MSLSVEVRFDRIKKIAELEEVCRLIFTSRFDVKSVVQVFSKIMWACQDYVNSEFVILEENQHVKNSLWLENSHIRLGVFTVLLV